MVESSDRKGPARPIRWLHLSDFHFRGLQRWERRTTLDALLRWAKETTETGEGPDLVFLTGDIAWSGKREEYLQAQSFFEKLAEATGLDPIERFFVVPGNHDVDRSRIGREAKMVRDLDEQSEIEDVLADVELMQLLGRRLEAFYHFTEDFLGPARAIQPERPFRVDLRELEGVDLAVLQLNSAWTAGTDDDTGKLLVGEAQVRDALVEASAAPVRIALIHHPISDLADVDRARLETLLPAMGGVHVLLRGHLHRGRLLGSWGPHGEMAELAAGTVYSDGKWPRGFFQAELDRGRGSLQARFLAYSDEGRGFWAPDSRAIEGRPDGTWKLALPASLRNGTVAAEKAVVVATENRRRSLAARYRAAVAAVHGTVRFVGFADSRPRRNVQVPELFVPLRVRVLERPEVDWNVESFTTAEILAQLVARPAEPARLVVLGDPGSGKTTLCRFLSVALAGEASVEEVDVPGEPLPLFLPFRDYVRQCREAGDRDLLTYLVEQARNHLQVALTREDLEAALGAATAVLLLDGLDEVGLAGEREEMRERVQAFCRAWRVPVLVTSRVSGYDDAPLPSGPGGFRQLRLEPFDDSDLERFVVRWYAAQEPEDPRAREERVADLRAALAADDRVRELARNPMLATLIALVHRFEAHLPGERAKLYELCVKTLLETWPASRRRRFLDIDEGLQRAYLEELAYGLQQRRSGPRAEVIVARRDLVQLLCGIVARDRGGREEVFRGTVERWVDYLEEGTGILVEPRPGCLAFLHRSLLEYLAARGWERATDLVEGIASQFTNPWWREVCLLAIGSRATDHVFLTRIFDRLTGGEPARRTWDFLLAALGDEAAFDDEQRDRIASATARSTVDGQLSDRPQRFQRLQRLSLRHRVWAQRWVAAALATSRGDALVGAVLLVGHDEEATVDALGRRGDCPAAAADLLDLGTVSATGRWAMGEASQEAVERWLSATPGEVVPVRALFALSAVDARRFSRPAIAMVLGSATRFRRMANEAIGELARRKRRGGVGLPATVTARPGDLRASTWPCGASMPSDRVERPPWRARTFTRAFSAAFALGFFDSGCIFPIACARAFSGHVARAFVRGFTTDFTLVFALDFAHAFALDFARTFANDASGELALDFARQFAIDLHTESTRSAPSTRIESPAQQALPADLAAREPGSRGVGPALERCAPLLLARLAVEAAMALLAAVERSEPEQIAHVGRRLQNAWILQIWHILDGHLDRDPHPNRLALYLALGWSQATTTWLWPGTPRWIEILGGPPPAEWRPRAVWHLCWQLHDPSHAEGIRRALAEGRAEDPGDAMIAAIEDAAGLEG